MHHITLTVAALCLFASCYLTKEDKQSLELCNGDKVCIEETMVIIEEEHEYRRGMTYIDAYTKFLRLEQHCRSMGKGVQVECDVISQWCGRARKHRKMSVWELKSASCARF